ncbi:MAG TPA: MMPL family transporter, partial [Rhizomicrobium sp.]
MPLIETIVAFCCRHARAVIAAGVLAAVASCLYTANNFAMNTNSVTLTSADLPWRKEQARFDKLFPQRDNLILVVIDGATAERANGAANMLAAKLAENKMMFPAVRRPDGGEFFERNGLLFLSEREVRETMQKLVTAQPFLGALAADPSLRGVMDSVDTALIGVARGDAKLADIDEPMAAFAGTLEKVQQGQASFLSWRTLFTGNTGGERLRAFVEVQPKLDFDALSPGAVASKTIRQEALALGMTPDKGLRVRLTGPVPLADEEFASISDSAGLMSLAMLLAVTFSLWLAVRSFRIIFCILATLITGLSLTMALGLLVVGVFNIISIAFVALFVGLGVDFAIQFAVRYRSERYRNDDLVAALKRTGWRVGTPLALAAAATAAGFFSFIPTDYVGVAELGLIAGMGMIVAFVLSVSLLPALIMLVKPAGEEMHVGFAFFAPVDEFMVTHRRRILIAGAVVGAAALATVPFLKFDFNPLNLRNRHVESMATVFDLMKDPDTSPNTIDVMAPSLADTDKLAAKLQQNP